MGMKIVTHLNNSHNILIFGLNYLAIWHLALL